MIVVTSKHEQSLEEEKLQNQNQLEAMQYNFNIQKKDLSEILEKVSEELSESKVEYQKLDSELSTLRRELASKVTELKEANDVWEKEKSKLVDLHVEQLQEKELLLVKATDKTVALESEKQNLLSKIQSLKDGIEFVEKKLQFLLRHILSSIECLISATISMLNLICQL